MVTCLRESSSLRRANDAVMPVLRRTVDHLIAPNTRLQLVAEIGLYEYTESIDPDIPNRKPYGQITTEELRTSLAQCLISVTKQRFALYGLKVEVKTPISPQIGMNGKEVSVDDTAKTHTVQRQENLVLQLQITVNRWHWMGWKLRRRIWLWRQRRTMIW